MSQPGTADLLTRYSSRIVRRMRQSTRSSWIGQQPPSCLPRRKRLKFRLLQINSHFLQDPVNSHDSV